MERKKEFEEIISQSDIVDVIHCLRNEYTVEDIVSHLPEEYVLDCFAPFELIDYLDDTPAFLEYVDDKIAEYNDKFNEELTEIQKKKRDITLNDSDKNWMRLCDYLDVQYTNAVELKEKVGKMLESLNKSTYNKDKINFK